MKQCCKSIDCVKFEAHRWSLASCCCQNSKCLPHPWKRADCRYCPPKLLMKEASGPPWSAPKHLESILMDRPSCALLLTLCLGCSSSVSTIPSHTVCLISLQAHTDLLSEVRAKSITTQRAAHCCKLTHLVGIIGVQSHSCPATLWLT